MLLWFRGPISFFSCTTKCLLALNFTLSSADELLVQVDDSELSKLVNHSKWLGYSGVYISTQWL